MNVYNSRMVQSNFSFQVQSKPSEGDLVLNALRAKNNYSHIHNTTATPSKPYDDDSTVIATSNEKDQYRLFDSLPFGTVTILGKEYPHFNIVDSVLDSQFVRMASVIEQEYKSCLTSR